MHLSLEVHDRSLQPLGHIRPHEIAKFFKDLGRCLGLTECQRRENEQGVFAKAARRETNLAPLAFPQEVG